MSLIGTVIEYEKLKMRSNNVSYFSDQAGYLYFQKLLNISLQRQSLKRYGMIFSVRLHCYSHHIFAERIYVKKIIKKIMCTLRVNFKEQTSLMFCMFKVRHLMSDHSSLPLCTLEILRFSLAH